ncbi:hypothetical protein [Methylophilus aquaticus]|uniref:Uncharacterized protein n=1 Tax=Methylophilus aquaticus TaxID=1971610 RepID=A0ABT9JP00_9PROT|nr:hypothetical protein [Methylophilus aquaticus]MDP8566308.1 hypothetical protein [Methylophilus aquaticus]
MRKNKLLFAVAMWILSAPLHACIEASALQRLAESEMGYMSQRIPPAFADAVADRQIQGNMQIASADACQLHWQLTLPAADIEEAQAILQAQPAKQIMLAAQGYEIPAQTSLDALFLLDEKRMQPQPKEGLQTAPLGKLRASVELMYALLTQARADAAARHPVWTEPETQILNAQCAMQFVAKEDIQQACACRTQEISARFTARQVRYNQYISSNPYAFASGNGGDFKQLDKRLQERCGLAVR